MGTAQGNSPAKRSLLPIILLLSDGAHSLTALIDSGADEVSSVLPQLVS